MYSHTLFYEKFYVSQESAVHDWIFRQGASQKVMMSTSEWGWLESQKSFLLGSRRRDQISICAWFMQMRVKLIQEVRAATDAMRDEIKNVPAPNEIRRIE